MERSSHICLLLRPFRLLYKLYLVVLVVFLLSDGSVSGKILGAAVIPHGDFAYDPTLVDNKGGALELHHSSVGVGHWIESLKPDLIFLTTPHGLAENNNFLLYGNTNGSGSALLGQDLLNNCTVNHKPTYKVHMSSLLSPNDASDILTESLKFPLNVSKLVAFGDSEPIGLSWGEIIPLSFFEHVTIPTVIMSMPTRRLTHTVSMIPELQRLGNFIGHYFEQASSPNVVVVISSDLAHTHLQCGPYGFSEAAEPFDQACGEWAKTLDSDHLLVAAAGLVEDALSCGYTGLVLLDGILGKEKTSSWKPELLANFHPTYYGMMVAKFERLEGECKYN